MQKRGQISAFVVLGLVLVLIIAFLFYPKDGLYSTPQLQEELKQSSTIPIEFEGVEEFINSCLEETIKNGIFVIGKQGGYYDLPEDRSRVVSSVEFNPFDEERVPIAFFIELSPYYFDRGLDLIPKIDFIEKELTNYIEDNLNVCVRDFEDFYDFANFTYDSPKITSKILDDKISVQMDYPIFIQRGNFNFRLNSFSENINFDFYEKYKIVESIIDEQKKDSKFIPIGFITNLAYENNFTFEVTNLDESATLFVLMFNDEKLFENSKYIYTFIIKT